MIQIYQHMMEQATCEKALDYFKFDVPQDIEDIYVWRGIRSNIAADLNLKQHLVDQAITQLRYVESVRRVYKGSAGHPSIYWLIEPPDQNKFALLQERSYRMGRFKSLTLEQRLQESVTRLTNRVIALEEEVERLKRVQKNDAVRYPQW